MQLRIKNYLLFTCLALPLSCLGGTMKDMFDFGPSKLWSVPLQVGFYGASQGKEQNINIQDMTGNRYTVDNDSQIRGLVGIGLYFKGYSQEFFQLSYGVNLFYLGKTTVSGDVVQEQLFTNYTYQYDIQNLPIYVAGKAIIYTKSPAYDITFDVGIGPNFMWTSNYREIPRDSFTVPDQAFKGASATTFSATVGVGLRLNNILKSMPVECGYRFFYLGEGHLNIANDQYLNNLNTGHTYANALVCSVTA